jgi:hypothetical protein
MGGPAATMSNRSREWDRRTASAFATVEREAREGLFSGDPGAALIRLITFAGRVPFDRAIRSLTPWERSVVEGSLGRPDVAIMQEPDNRYPATTVVIAQGALGKASFYRVGEGLSDGDRAIGAMQVPPSVLERASDIAGEQERLEAIASRWLERSLVHAETKGRLGQVVADVRDRVDHVESVYVYVGRRAFCRSDVGNTLLRGGRLEQLERLPLRLWGPDERLFVAAFHALFLAGRSIRIEEFNGEQLAARRLRAWLLRKWQLYAQELGLPATSGEAPDDPEELARQVGALQARITTAGSYLFRRINGLTMAKHEFVGHLDDLQPAPAALPSLVGDHLRRLGIGRDGLDPHEATRRAARYALADGDAEAVERLLERIVLAAVVAAGADYGMSSGVRDLSRLRGESEGSVEAMLRLAKNDFFCATVPHPSLVECLDAETMCDVLHSVAKRMQFNRWHFLPGNFKREDVPLKRHFFYPPVMPDIAEWTDLRHPGHTNASVRYTIRAPGPALWRPPLRVFGLELRGCFDIRLVRMVGPPFTSAEVRIACQHCHLVDAVWRAVAEAVEDGGAAPPPLSGFTREEYYEATAWNQAVAEAQALAKVPA